MKRLVRTGNVGICRFAGGSFMRGKIIIRIRRKNEFNKYWIILLVMAVINGVTSLRVETWFAAFVIIYINLIILIFALLYQGFEIIKE